MENIGSYLDRFKKFKNPREDKLTIARIVKELTTFDVMPEEINIRKGTVMFRTNPYLRTAIYSKKDALLDELKKAGLHVTTIV